MRAIWVGVAGFFGAASRYWLDGVVSRATGGSFPWGTRVVNISGCFVLGLLTTVLTERLMVNTTLRVALTVGFIGAYTTFSTFTYETVRLGQDGAVGLAFVNAASSVAVGIGAAWLGIALGKAL